MSISTPHESCSPELIGNSPAMSAVHRDIACAARSQAKVLIVGETGVGKEIVARRIHAGGARRSQPFVAINCTGIPETLLASELFGHVRGSFTGAYRDKRGLLGQADRGTLFLDELGEMSLAMQAALLRFTETGEIHPVGADGPGRRADIRLLTATNRNLRTLVEAGAFRDDLYYRLNVIQIHVPPLRERGDDILVLFRHYLALARAGAAHRGGCPELTRDAEQVLLHYAWPGNVRELRNVTERLVLRDSEQPIAPDALPPEIRAAVPARARRASLPSPHAAGSEAAGQAPGPSGIPGGAQRPATRVDRLWARLMAGEDFWTVVHHAFRAREITRSDLEALIDRGLRHTGGSYRALVKAFNLPASDYKRLHAFLYQQQCNLPVGRYRTAVIQGAHRRGHRPRCAVS
jgi:DNA-binding NtrC family response regulator